MTEGSRSPRRNKHGVPVLPFTGSRDRCIWPQCGRVATTYERARLCDEHGEFVHGVVERSRPEPVVEPEKPDWIEVAFQAHREELARKAAKRRPDPEPVPPREVIYYVKNGGHIKIGWTSNLTKRMRAYPPGCELMAVHDGSRADERKLHQRFAVHRSHGREWYPLAPVILDHIKRMVAEHGTPDDVDFGARPVEVPQPRRKQFVAVRSRSGGSYGRAG